MEFHPLPATHGMSKEFPIFFSFSLFFHKAWITLSLLLAILVGLPAQFGVWRG